MNFDEAIKAHSDWKMKLNRYIANPDKSIDIQTLSKDNACALGQWLYGEGKAYNKLPEYNELLQEHAKFHKAAGDIVRRCDHGEEVKAELSLGAHSPFSEHSTRVVSLLMHLKKKV